MVGNEKVGLLRKELYVDARDLQKSTDEVTLTDSQYIEALKNRGNNKLSERKRILTLSGEVPTSSKLFKLGEDYQLGDTITIKSIQLEKNINDNNH